MSAPHSSSGGAKDKGRADEAPGAVPTCGKKQPPERRKQSSKSGGEPKSTDVLPEVTVRRLDDRSAAGHETERNALSAMFPEDGLAAGPDIPPAAEVHSERDSEAPTGIAAAARGVAPAVARSAVEIQLARCTDGLERSSAGGGPLGQQGNTAGEQESGVVRNGATAPALVESSNASLVKGSNNDNSSMDSLNATLARRFRESERLSGDDIPAARQTLYPQRVFPDTAEYLTLVEELPLQSRQGLEPLSSASSSFNSNGNVLTARPMVSTMVSQANASVPLTGMSPATAPMSPYTFISAQQHQHNVQTVRDSSYEFPFVQSVLGNTFTPAAAVHSAGAYPATSAAPGQASSTLGPSVYLGPFLPGATSSHAQSDTGVYGEASMSYSSSVPNVYSGPFMSASPQDQSSLYVNAISLGSPEIPSSGRYVVQHHSPQQPLQALSLEATPDLMASCASSIAPDIMGSAALSAGNPESYVLSNLSTPIMTVPQAPPPSPYFTMGFPQFPDGVNGGNRRGSLYSIAHVPFAPHSVGHPEVSNVPADLLDRTTQEPGGRTQRYHKDNSGSASDYRQPQFLQTEASAAAGPDDDDDDDIPNDVKSSLVVFYIPKSWTLMRLHDTFAPYGRVLQYRLDTDPETGNRKGRGFVQFDCPESAVFAMKALNGRVVEGNRRLKVQLKRFLSPRYRQTATADGGNRGGGVSNRQREYGHCNAKVKTYQQTEVASRKDVAQHQMLPTGTRYGRPQRGSVREQDVRHPHGEDRSSALQHGDSGVTSEHSQQPRAPVAYKNGNPDHPSSPPLHYLPTQRVSNRSQKSVRAEQQRELGARTLYPESSAIPSTAHGRPRESFDWLSSMIAITVGNMDSTAKVAASEEGLPYNVASVEGISHEKRSLPGSHTLGYSHESRSYDEFQDPLAWSRKPAPMMFSADHLDNSCPSESNDVLGRFGRPRASSTHACLGTEATAGDEVSAALNCDALNMLLLPTPRHQRSASEGCCDVLTDEHSGDDGHLSEQAITLSSSKGHYPSRGVVSPRDYQEPRYGGPGGGGGTPMCPPAGSLPTNTGPSPAPRTGGRVEDADVFNPATANRKFPGEEYARTTAKPDHHPVSGRGPSSKTRVRHAGGAYTGSDGIIPGNNLFVFHIPPDWKEADFREQFSKFGPVRCLNFPKDSVTPWGHRGYGFICYETREAACRAIEEMDGKEIELGRRLKVEFKKPLNTKHRANGAYPSVASSQGERSTFTNRSAGRPRGVPLSGGDDRLAPAGMMVRQDPNMAGAQQNSVHHQLPGSGGVVTLRGDMNSTHQPMGTRREASYNGFGWYPAAVTQYPHTSSVSVRGPGSGGTQMGVRRPDYPGALSENAAREGFVKGDGHLVIDSSQLTGLAGQLSLRSGSTSIGDHGLSSSLPSVSGTEPRQHLARIRAQEKSQQPAEVAYSDSSPGSSGSQYCRTTPSDRYSFPAMPGYSGAPVATAPLAGQNPVVLNQLGTAYPQKPAFGFPQLSVMGIPDNGARGLLPNAVSVATGQGTDSFPSTSSSFSSRRTDSGPFIAPHSTGTALNSASADWRSFPVTASFSGGNEASSAVLGSMDLHPSTQSVTSQFSAGPSSRKSDWPLGNTADMPLLELRDAIAAAVTGTNIVPTSEP